LPDVPVIVRLYVPVRALLFTWILRTEDPEPVTVDGFQDADVRAGKPLTLKDTVPVKL